MNSTLLRFLALFLALGAILMAAIGYRLSTKQAPIIAPAPPMTYPQVMAARDIPASQLLTAQDVRLESLPHRDPLAYDTLGKVVGKLTLEPIQAGTPLLSRHFPRLGQVAQSLKPGERGVAIKVTEVIGVGGFVTPGDHVDVLLYLRGTKETGEISSSQVLLRDVRVLAYGEDLEETGPKPTALQKMAGDEKTTKADTPKKENEKGKASRSAILAVQEKDASRLMLGESTGQLRLALRGAEPPAMTTREEDAARYLRLAELSSPDAVPRATPPVSTVAAGTPVRKSAARPKPVASATSSVIVHRGDQVERVTVKN